MRPHGILNPWGLFFKSELFIISSKDFFSREQIPDFNTTACYKCNKVNIKMKKLILVLTSLLITLCISSQGNKNLAEMLGYPGDSKLLIIHADDMGLSHSVNMACIRAFENNVITSGSIMVPCPWASEIIEYAKNHSGMDVGIHLTLTAEWDLYKWDGITASDQIPSLLDKNNYFYPSVEELGKAAKSIEAEKELRAQIDKAIASGVQPTHDCSSCD